MYVVHGSIVCRVIAPYPGHEINQRVKSAKAENNEEGSGKTPAPLEVARQRTIAWS